jgi:hypothetical protein
MGVNVLGGCSGVTFLLFFDPFVSTTIAHLWIWWQSQQLKTFVQQKKSRSGLLDLDTVDIEHLALLKSTSNELAI